MGRFAKGILAGGLISTAIFMSQKSDRELNRMKRRAKKTGFSVLEAISDRFDF